MEGSGACRVSERGGGGGVGDGGREDGRSRRCRHDSWNQSCSRRQHHAICLRAYTHFTRKALHHRLALALRVIRAPTAAERTREVAPIHVHVVRRPRLLARVDQTAACTPTRCGAVAREVPPCKQLDLLVLAVARDRARCAHARTAARHARVHELLERAERVRARVEAVRDRGRGVSDERALRREQVRRCDRRGGHMRNRRLCS
jgi:hypothetical protein